MISLVYGIKVPKELVATDIKGLIVCSFDAEYNIVGTVFVNESNNVLELSQEFTHSLNDYTNDEKKMGDFTKKYENLLKSWVDSGLKMPDKLGYEWYVVSDVYSELPYGSDKGWS